MREHPILRPWWRQRAASALSREYLQKLFADSCIGQGSPPASLLTSLQSCKINRFRIASSRHADPTGILTLVMEITLLGTGAPLHPGRAMTGMIVTAPSCAPLLIDTCGGLELARQLEFVGFERSNVRAVIVTHRHLDHAGGIQDLLLARMPLDIFALRDTHDGIAAVTAGSFPEWDLHPDIIRHEIYPGDARDIAGFRVEFFAAKHRVPTVAVRVTQGTRTFAFSADTVACEEVVACARNVDLFLCDTFCAELDGEEIAKRARATMHLTAREAAAMTTRASAGALVCTHLARFANPVNILAEAKMHFADSVTVAQDGDRYCI
jgi:ribonuclease BN (tRNA processing enzyme)